MKLKFNKIFLTFVIFLLLLTGNNSFAQNPILKTINELQTQNYSIWEWKVMPDNEIVFHLYYNNGESRNEDFYQAYAVINNDGMLSFDPICIPGTRNAIFMSYQKYLIDERRRLIRYWDRGHDLGWALIRRAIYAPRMKKMKEIEFSPPGSFLINGANNIPGIGNVIMAQILHSEFRYHLVIDNLKSKKPKLYGLPKIEGFHYPHNDVQLISLPDNKILVVGTKILPSGKKHTVRDFMLSSFVFDLKKKKIISCDNVLYNDLLLAGAPILELIQTTQIFNVGNRIFYISMNYIDEYSISFHHPKPLIVEINQNGKFVVDESYNDITIEYESITEIPENFIILRHYKYPDKRYWLMSLDNFPILVIDKGD